MGRCCSELLPSWRDFRNEQETAGAWILAELESEPGWDDLFARSPDLLSVLAAEAIREDDAGLTEAIDPEA